MQNSGSPWSVPDELQPMRDYNPGSQRLNCTRKANYHSNYVLYIKPIDGTTALRLLDVRFP